MRTVWHAVADQAERTPQATAIRGEASYSYAELQDRVHELSQEILSRAQPGDLLALEAMTPAAGAIAILAAAKSGCAVLPLNLESPPIHRESILGDAAPQALVRETEGAEFAVEAAAAPATRPGAGPRSPRDMRAVAYVMYTSGSTGRPKGVMVSHEALVTRLEGLSRFPGFSSNDSILAMTALSFDISIAELLLPLTVGGCFVAAPPGARLDPAIFARTVDEYSPSLIQATPSFWRLALAWGWKGSKDSRLWCGGEALTSSLARRLLPLCAELWNLYGPTETTIYASAARIRTADRIDLGGPLHGTGLCLAADTGEPVTGPGAPGEILLYDAGLALGYLNLPGLTAERFHVASTPDGLKFCYRSGDRARYRQDGTLEFLGRTDDQVKLRGNRIELGELEAVAEEHPAVLEAAAVLRDADSPATAHIAVVVVTDGTVGHRDIRRWLTDRLPPAMRPGRISTRLALPRTQAGKLDRVKLANGPLD